MKSSWFVWDFPCFSTERFVSWEIPQSQANRDGHPTSEQSVRTGGSAADPVVPVGIQLCCDGPS